MNFPSIALLTDFGEQDGFVGILKCVMLQRLNQPVPWIDLSHQIPPQAIAQGAWTLNNALPFLPSASVSLCIVDPHVGNPNQAALLIYVKTAKQFFIGPDNGLLSPIWAHYGEANCQFFDIRSSELYQTQRLGPMGRSQTFHGRDVYAPIAAMATNALLEEDVDTFLSQFEKLPTLPIALTSPEAERIEIENNKRSLRGQVIHVDRYGNLITNIPIAWLPTGASIHARLIEQSTHQTVVDLKNVLLMSSYDAVSPEGKHPFRLIPSSGGTLELAAFRQSAIHLLELPHPGQPLGIQLDCLLP